MTLTVRGEAVMAELESRRSANGSAFLLILMCLAILALGWRVFQQRAAIRARDDQIAAFTRELSSASVEHDGLVALMNRDLSTAELLRGLDPRTRDSVIISSPATGVFGIISTTCAACAKNYSALARLAKAAPGQVAVAAPADFPEDVVRSFRGQDVTFRVLTSPSGWLLQRIPPIAVPLTALVHRDSIAIFVTGVLKPEVVQEMADSLERWNGHPPD
jgi:hypothetical protein